MTRLVLLLWVRKVMFFAWLSVVIAEDHEPPTFICSGVPKAEPLLASIFNVAPGLLGAVRLMSKPVEEHSPVPTCVEAAPGMPLVETS